MIQHRNELYKLLPKDAVAAELGTAEGFNASDMCKWDSLKTLYVVDAWKTLPVKGDGGYNQEWHDKNYFDAMARLKPFEKKVTILRGLTYQMAASVDDGELDLLYIDADHSYRGVLLDLNAWYAKVKSGGIVAGHDYLNLDYGVNAAVYDFCRNIGIIPITIPEKNKEDAGFYFLKP
jgi:hypothetical protein